MDGAASPPRPRVCRGAVGDDVAFPPDERGLRPTEEALGYRLPPDYRAHVLRDNGGEIETDDDVWRLVPVRNAKDRKTLSRTADDILRETGRARELPAFPPDGLVVARNEEGDLLLLRVSATGDRLHLFRWRRQRLASFAATIAELEIV